MQPVINCDSRCWYIQLVCSPRLANKIDGSRSLNAGSAPAARGRGCIPRSAPQAAHILMLIRTHVAKARAELDEAIAKLSGKLAESAHAKKTSPPLAPAQLLSALRDDDGALIDQLVNLSLNGHVSGVKSNKPLSDKVSSFISSLLPLTSVALGLVGKAFDASLMGVPVAAITNGTCFIVDLIIKERDRKDLFLVELDRIAYQARRVQEIQRYPDTILLPLLREKALCLLTAITLFLAGAIDYFARSIVRQIAKSVFKGAEVWQKRITDLRLACEEYDQALLLQVASTALQRSRPSETVAGDDAKIRGWLQPSAAENDSRMMANLARRAEGTLQWVLAMPELKAWRLEDASVAAKTLWLTGLPGVGKSCISAYLCNLLPSQYPDDIVLSFFCKRETQGLNTVFAIVRTLCYQLMVADDFYRKFLQEVPALPQSVSKDDVLFFVDKLLRKPIVSGLKDQTIFILLDGLDELEDSGHIQGRGTPRRSDVEILLEQLVTLPRVKILATSRRIPEIDKILSESGIVKDIGPNDNASDIERYVAHRVTTSSKLHDGFSDMKVDALEFFSSKANGVFLWVSIILDVLENALSAKIFEQALGEIHPTMSSIYNDIFERAARRGTLELILEVLNWTLILPIPLTVQQMALAVGISLGDRVWNMEDFLRTECGSFLALVPRLGSKGSIQTDGSLEIHIGHETFQAWLLGKLGPEVRLTAHAKASSVCLKYLLGRFSDGSLRTYALQRWRWHLRHSLGVGERAQSKPSSILASGSAVPNPQIAADLFLNLYRFLTGHQSEDWILRTIEDPDNHARRLFPEVRSTCLEVTAWCRTNASSINDATLGRLGVKGSELQRLKVWRDSINSPTVIAHRLWPRVCRAWLWNSSASWSKARLGARALYRHYLYIRAHLEGEETPESPPLSPRIGPGVACLEAIKAAGRYDDLSSICASNISIFLYEMTRPPVVSTWFWSLDGTKGALQAALETIQEAIADDPDGSPRNYYHLGQVYSALHSEGGSDNNEDLRAKALQAYRDAVARDPDKTTDARSEVYQADEDALRRQEPPALDAAVELLERAILDHPANACNQWFRRLFNLHRLRGDQAAARDTYKRLVALDPASHTKWHDIADTWIDQRSFGDDRTFDWRNWCDTLIEAVQQDPNYAHSYWYEWENMAAKLSTYQHFGIAIDILLYGIENSALRTDKHARDACAALCSRLGNILCQTGDWKRAIPYLEDAFARGDRMSIARQRNVLRWLAWAYMAELRWDDATAAANKRLALPLPAGQPRDPFPHSAHGWLGDIALYQDKHAAALQEFKTALRMIDEEMTAGSGGRDSEKTLEKRMAQFLFDLGTTYERMDRLNQARASFKRAIPQVEEVLRDTVERREKSGRLTREEGRWHMCLARALERSEDDGISNPRVLNEYKLAEWAFKKTAFVEDDFVELGDIMSAEAAIRRVQAREPYSYPDREAFRAEGMRLKIASLRADWACDVDDDGADKPRRRGHA